MRFRVITSPPARSPDSGSHFLHNFPQANSTPPSWTAPPTSLETTPSHFQRNKTPPHFTAIMQRMGNVRRRGLAVLLHHQFPGTALLLPLDGTLPLGVEYIVRRNRECAGDRRGDRPLRESGPRTQRQGQQRFAFSLFACPPCLCFLVSSPLPDVLECAEEFKALLEELKKSGAATVAGSADKMLVDLVFSALDKDDRFRPIRSSFVRTHSRHTCC